MKLLLVMLCLVVLSSANAQDSIWIEQVHPDERLYQHVKRLVTIKNYLRNLLADFGDFSPNDIGTVEIAIRQKFSLAKWKKKFLAQSQGFEIEVIGYHTNKSELGDYEDLWNTIIYSFIHNDDRLMHMQPTRIKRPSR